MVGLPRLHGKLGAKRVEVTACAEWTVRRSREWVWKTCQQQHV